MALSETRPPDKNKTEHNKGPDKKEKLPTKVIIRRLPPQMDSETFLNQISPIPSYDYFYMVKGDLNLGENAFSRAYINFTSPHDVYDFKEKFDNYVFVDSNSGHEYPAVVEFSSFQKIPKKRNKIRVDPKCGSIESDPIYQEFVEFIKNPPQPEEKPEFTLQLASESKNAEVVSTPLLEFVKNKRAERLRIREERREERRKKEFERKKFQEERKKTFDERSPLKYKNQYSKIKEDVEKEKEAEKVEVEEKPVSTVFYKSREKKYDDRKRDMRPGRFPAKKDYPEKREFKSRREEYKTFPKFEEKKVESDPKVKKVKKYSEKREERKMEAQKKLEQQPQPKEDNSKVEEVKKQEIEENREKSRTPESDGQAQKRIRNKDRPTIAIYRPGMLSKKKQTEEETENGKKE